LRSREAHAGVPRPLTPCDRSAAGLAYRRRDAQALAPRGAGAAAIVASSLVAISAPALAQTDPSTTVANSPATAAGTTTTTIACPVFADLKRIHRNATNVGASSVRFHVDRLEAGAIGRANIESTTPTTRASSSKATQYRVPVLRDAESDRFVSKVRPVAPIERGHRGMRQARSGSHDDGRRQAIDTGVFSGLRGKSSRAIWAFCGRCRRARRLIVLVAVKRVTT